MNEIGDACDYCCNCSVLLDYCRTLCPDCRKETIICVTCRDTRMSSLPKRGDHFKDYHKAIDLC